MQTFLCLSVLSHIWNITCIDANEQFQVFPVQKKSGIQLMPTFTINLLICSDSIHGQEVVPCFILLIQPPFFWFGNFQNVYNG